jgi:hypothetical protein
MAGRMTHREIHTNERQPTRGCGGTRPHRAQVPLRVIALCLAVAAGAAGQADVPPAQAAEVEHLIERLAGSDCEMVRNGKAHSGAEGANHVRNKYDHFRDEIDSTEAFIGMAATKSLMSGRPYEVRCPGQPPVPSAQWLLEELEDFRESR